jgi:hypothetical protein
MDVISTREAGFMMILILCTAQQPARLSRMYLTARKMDGLIMFISNIDGSLAVVHYQGTCIYPCLPGSDAKRKK